MIGIYCIENTINGNKYIGQSANIKKRWITHKQELNNNTHHNEHLQKAWNKYGQDVFKFYVIEKCDTSALDERELYYISLFDTHVHGYNMTDGGEGTRGYKHTADYKERMRDIFTGRTFSEETRKKMSLAKKGNAPKETENRRIGRIKAAEKMKGRKFTEEHKIHLSESLKGRKAWNKGMKIPKESHNMYGKHHSEETKRKISLANKGKTNSLEHRIQSAKPVICIETGKEYWSITEAAKEYGTSIHAISNALRGKSQTCRNLHWKYKDTTAEK